MECEFCREIVAGHCPALGPSPVGRWIRETEHFVVMPTIGAIQGVRAWLLITSRDHQRSAGMLTPEQLIELEWLIAEMVDDLGARYDTPVIVFEHGPGVLNRGGACIDHVHMHVVAANIDLFNGLVPLWPRPIKTLLELSLIAQRGAPYLLYQNNAGQRWVVEPRQDTPSQFLRQLVARQLGVPERYDWAVCPELPTLARTVQEACPYCQELSQRNFCFDGVSYGDRIVGQSDHFAIMPTQGCLTPGHLVIFALPHAHGVWLSDFATELEEVMDITGRVIHDCFGVRPVFFDHGSAPRTFPHGHWHVVPLAHQGPPIMNVSHDVIPVANFRELERHGTAMTLTWQDSVGQRFLLRLRGARRQQLLRQVVARQLGRLEFWDWRIHPFVQNMMYTRDILAGKLFAA